MICKAVWKSATGKHGELSVTINLTMLTHQSYVASLDSLELVNSICCTEEKLYLTYVDAIAASGAAFGQGTGAVIISGLQCFGNETNVTQCPGADFTTSACPHSRDIGVTCQVRQCK